jgi:hypothetical protein
MEWSEREKDDMARLRWRMIERWDRKCSHTVIIKLETRMSGYDGGEQANRAFV